MTGKTISAGIKMTGLAFLIASCVPTVQTIRTRNDQVYSCAEKRPAGGILTSDECSFYEGVVYETDYGPDGSGGDNDTRKYYGYFMNGVEIRPGSDGYGLPWNRRTIGVGMGNCNPSGTCSQEAKVDPQSAAFGETEEQRAFRETFRR